MRRYLDSRTGKFGRGVAIGAILSAMVFTLSACDQSPAEDAARFLQRAEESYSSGDLRAAVIELRNALQRDPKNADARLLLGRVLLQGGDAAGAEKELSRAWELGSQSEEVKLLLAKARIARGNYAVVADSIEPDTDLSSPITRDLLVARGEALLGLGKVEAAQQLFDRILADGPHTEAFANKTRVALYRGNQEKARELLDKGLAHAPDDINLAALEADWLYREGRFEEAAARFREIKSVASKRLMAQLGEVRAVLASGDVKQAEALMASIKTARPDNLAVVFEDSLLQFAAGNYERAETAAERVLAVNERQSTALRIAGSSAYKLDKLERARARLSQYLVLRPEDAETRKVLVATLLRLGQAQEAKSTLKPLLKEALEPIEDEQLLSLAGAVMVRTGNVEQALRYLDQITRFSAQDTAFRAEVGGLKLAAGEVEGAVTDLQQVLNSESESEEDPSYGQALRALILLLIQEQRFDEALVRARELQGREPDNKAGFVLEGVIQLSMGNESKARSAFSKALEVAPGAPDAAANLAMLDLREGRVDSARAMLESVLEVTPGHLRTLLLLADLELKAGRPQARERALQQAVDAHPEELEPRILLARHFLVIGKEERVVEVAKPALDQSPDNAALLEVVSRAQLATDPTAAFPTLTRWSELRPTSGEPLFLLGTAYLTQGDAAAAREELRRALEVEPKHQGARLALTELMLSNDELEQARVSLQTLLEDLPENPVVMELAGRLALKEGRPEDALRHFTKAREQLDIAAVARGKAQAQWAIGKQAESIRTLEEWLSRSPDDHQSRALLAGYYISEGKVDEARESYKHIVQAQPENWFALNELAWLLLDNGNPKEALPYAEKAYSLAPKNSEIADTFGVVLLANGESTRAVSVLERAQRNNRPDIEFHYAQALADTGKTREARKVLEEMLQGEQNFEDRRAAEALLSRLQD